MKISGITGLVLAGGLSTRMEGRDKKSILIDGRPLLLLVTELLTTLFEEVLIVTNSSINIDHKIFRNVILVNDIFPRRGPLGGLHSGLVYSSFDTVFCVGCDMPALSKEMIEKQIEYSKKAEQGSWDAIVPRLDALVEPLHGLYKKTIENSLRLMLSEERNNSIQDLLRRVKTEYYPLENTEKNRSCFRNINTPKEYNEYLKKKKEFQLIKAV